MTVENVEAEGGSMESENRLRELRKRRKLNQDALAAASGVSQGAISKLEQGGRTPELETARKLATALGFKVGTIFPEFSE